MRKLCFVLLICTCTIPSFCRALAQTTVTNAVAADLAPRIRSVRAIRPSEGQMNYSADLKKDIATDSVRKLCIVYPGTIIRFEITNPLVFLKSRPKDQAKVVLYANGLELKGICTDWYRGLSSIDFCDGHYPAFGKTAYIYIVLERNENTQASWNFFYGKQDFFKGNADLDASIGWEGMSALEKEKGAQNLRVIFFYNWVFVAWSVLFLVLLCGFLVVGFRTNALRVGNMKTAYSLSLAQLLFWTTLVIAAFIYTLVLTDVPSGFNSSILLMLGISLGTTGVATTIDSRFKQQSAGIQKPSNGFFKDVLTSDGENYSVQRIQAFAWNLVLGLYFIIYTVGSRNMPEFSSTLLFLAGITSASYVGTKPSENSDLKRAQDGQGAGKDN